MLRLWIYGTIFGLRLIAYLIPAWVGLTVIGLMIFGPHMPEWMQSIVVWGIGTLIGAFLCAIPIWLFLDIPIAAGTIGCLVIVLCGEAAPIIARTWHAITSAVGAISPIHWGTAGVGITGLIVIGSWRAWRGRVPRPRADEDDDDFDDYFDDHRTHIRPVMRPAPPRLSRAERKAAAIYAEIERKAKVSAAWEAWYSGRGPGPF
jgi:hypothetical protein